MTPDELFRIVK